MRPLNNTTHTYTMQRDVSDLKMELWEFKLRNYKQCDALKISKKIS